MYGRLRQKGFNDTCIESTMDFLDRSRLINDERLAEDLFRYSTERRTLGKNGVRMFLLKRGIEKELVNKVLLKHSGRQEESSAREFAERKLRMLGQYPENVVKRRITGMLQRRGFSPDVVYKVVESIKL